jgi:hypothetical protein
MTTSKSSSIWRRTSLNVLGKKEDAPKSQEKDNKKAIKDLLSYLLSGDEVHYSFSFTCMYHLFKLPLIRFDVLDQGDSSLHSRLRFRRVTRGADVVASFKISFS